MAGYYNKDDLKQQLEIEQIFDLCAELGGEPEYAPHGLICQTICHNPPGEGSRKLYFYSNSQLFRCFTDCADSFDVFQLVIKAMKIQKNLDWELYDAMVYIAEYFGLGEAEKPTEENQALAQTWAVFKRHDFSLAQLRQPIILKEYNPVILTRFSYPRIPSWEKENIIPSIYRKSLIGYYAGDNQITIPHFDINGRLVGIRGRALAQEDVERWGKYRPLRINGIWYTHPLSMNLYNLNNSKENIKNKKAAIIFESEKSCLQFRSYYGATGDISVACCGSSVSSYQIDLLESLQVQEIVLAFDRQFQEIGDDEFQRLKKKIINIKQRYGNRFRITTIFDKNLITPYKASPTDISKEIFEKLLAERFTP